MGDADYQIALVLRKEGKYKEGRLFLESAFKKKCELAGYELMLAYRNGGWDLHENSNKSEEIYDLLREAGSLYVCWNKQMAIESGDPFLIYSYYESNFMPDDPERDLMASSCSRTGKHICIDAIRSNNMFSSR